MGRLAVSRVPSRTQVLSCKRSKGAGGRVSVPNNPGISTPAPVGRDIPELSTPTKHRGPLNEVRGGSRSPGPKAHCTPLLFLPRSGDWNTGAYSCNARIAVTRERAISSETAIEDLTRRAGYLTYLSYTPVPPSRGPPPGRPRWDCPSILTATKSVQIHRLSYYSDTTSVDKLSPLTLTLLQGWLSSWSCRPPSLTSLLTGPTSSRASLCHRAGDGRGD